MNKQLISCILVFAFNNIAQAICPFSDTFYISGGGTGVGVIDITPAGGNPRVTTGGSYKPSWVGSWFYSPSFLLTESTLECPNDQAQGDRTFTVKIGTDANNRYCILTVTDGAYSYGRVINSQCTGNIKYTRNDDKDANGFLESLHPNHSYYLYFE